MNINRKNIYLNFELDDIKKKLNVPYNREKIHKIWLVFTMLIVNGGSFKEIKLNLDLSYDFIRYALYTGYCISKDFYQKYFCSREYWTPSRFKNIINQSDYKILFGDSINEYNAIITMDGTSYKCCKVGNDRLQRHTFNGKSKMNCINFQYLIGIDGIPVTTIPCHGFFSDGKHGDGQTFDWCFSKSTRSLCKLFKVTYIYFC